MLDLFYIVSTDLTYIQMQYVESVSRSKDEDDALVDTLKNDSTFLIRTISGTEYVVSMLQLIEEFKRRVDTPATAKEMEKVFLQKWMHYGKTA